MKYRCRFAMRIWRYQHDGILGMRLMEVEDSWHCSLALRTCNGATDPGCGRYETNDHPVVTR